MVGMRYKRVLVTGGLGFIGSSISEHFLQKGCQVTIVDSRVSHVVDAECLLSKYHSAKIVQAAISDYLGNRLDVSDYDLLIHTASPVGPASILQYAGNIGSEIVSTTSQIIGACLESRTPLVYFSSAEVYGKSGMLREKDEIRVPPYYNTRIEYALAKLTCEAMVINSKTQGLNSVVIRPFNVAGPRQSRAGGFVMPTFVQQALGNRPLTVFGSGKQKRAFLSVDDVVNFVANHVDDNLLSRCEVYNLGNPGNGTTIEGLAIGIIELLESQSEIVYVDPKSIYGPLYFEAESFEKLPDVSKAISLGWKPRLSLDKIISETAKYYRFNRDTRGADARH
jgi:nucleoside-diphosphate-sugar epimerase